MTLRCYSYVWVDVFTQTRFGGNPLVVFPEADGLDAATMQQLAHEFNLSETTFVLADPELPADHARVRIFTPGREIPFAGHPTLGTAWVLRQQRQLTSERIILHEQVGLVPVVFGADGSLELQTALDPVYSPTPLSIEQFAEFLGVVPEEIVATEVISCGVAYTLVWLRSLAAIQAATYRWPQSHPLLQAHPALREVYLVCEQTCDPAMDFHVRMFAPGVGVPEDPATGSAAATLAAWLLKLRGPGQWLLEQGLEMGRPSQLAIRSETAGIFVKGHVVRFAEGTVEI